MDRETRIRQMEEAFDAASAALERFESALDEFEGAQDSLLSFSDYYGSEQWLEDYDAHAQGALPPDLKCGVLSEDLPYDALMEYHELCIRMLEIATRTLKRI